jgi:hypothetical protein
MYGYMEKHKPISFLAFYLMWAKLMGWTVPLLHVRICQWLEHCKDPVRVLLVFRGASKSTTYAVYKAWKLYRDNNDRSLIWAADDKLATKLTRDTLNVLRRHPLTRGMLPPKPGAQSFWVLGSMDARNPSMEAVGVNGNATGSRADAVDFDDVEVPKNIKTPEARQNLRLKIEESTHIAVPGAQKSYIGTPHTHDSIYTEQVQGGAAVLKIPLFEHHRRFTDTASGQQYHFGFDAGPDGLYVFAGIGKFAKLLVEDIDYTQQGRCIILAKPINAVLDIYAGNAWPERFTRAEVTQRRTDTRTLNGWDSQYQLEAKPVNETRLDPSRMLAYADKPVVRVANRETLMMLGKVRIVGARARWDVALGKIKSDASAFSLVLTDAKGNLYWQVAEGLMGDLDDQCKRVLALVLEYQIPRVVVETNGAGGFVPPRLRKFLFGTGCAVVDDHATVNKQKRILDAFEPPLSMQVLWAHTSVLDGPTWDQMKDFNPLSKNQPDDYLDSGAGAIADTPVRIGQIISTANKRAGHDWRPNSGTHEVILETA